MSVALPSEVCDQPFFRARYEMQQKHLAEIHRRFALPARQVLLRDGEVKGIASLRQMSPALRS
jgi:anion-transporting  ArsA/GET3 family ATPase